MKVRTAIRKTVKWGGAVAIVLLATLWIGSGWWCVNWHASATAEYYCAGGRLVINNIVDPGTFRVIGDAAPTEFVEVIQFDAPFAWWFDAAYTGVWYRRAVPLWFPLLLFLIPTPFAWWPDRRSAYRTRLGLCLACGYDRRGIAAGAVCPECGGAAYAGIAS